MLGLIALKMQLMHIRDHIASWRFMDRWRDLPVIKNAAQSAMYLSTYILVIGWLYIYAP